MNINHHFLNQDFFLPNWEIKVLVLGTFNPECGEQTDYFYGRKKNNFWKAIASIKKFDSNHYLDHFQNKLNTMIEHKFGCSDIIELVKVDKENLEKVCGNSYSDSYLFTQKYVKITYRFEEIKNYLITNKVEKVINTWGKRKSPKEFQKQIDSLKFFCTQNNILFIEDCLSPSPRSKNTIEILIDFYTKHLF